MMDINQSDRNQLKTYFVKHAVPSEQNFADLIDGMLNQKDDRIVKPAGGPLSLESSGDAASRRQVLNLYESFDDTNPAWTVSMNPRVSLSDPATAKRGLSIDDSSGASRLFIDYASGNVGIRTVEPQAALHVAGDILCSGKVTAAQLMATEALQEPTEWDPKWLNRYAPSVIAKFYKDNAGIVHLVGTVGHENHGDRPAGERIFQLPDGYRPERQISFIVASFNSVDMLKGFIHIGEDGWLSTGGGVNGREAYLDGIAFEAKSVDPS